MNSAWSNDLETTKEIHPPATWLDAMPADKREISGGSSANTAAGVASLGGKAAFIGKVADDDLGDIFAADLARIGVHYGVTRLVDGPATARSMILISPGGERTMNTSPGAAHLLAPAAVEEEAVRAAPEQYLWVHRRFKGFNGNPVSPY